MRRQAVASRRGSSRGRAAKHAHTSPERTPGWLAQRRRALMAGGAVAAIGLSATAASTMAAWTDSEQATSTFKAGTFATQSSPNNSTWTTGSGASKTSSALVFTPTAAAMLPGVSSYSPLWVRTTAASTAGGTLRSVAGTSTATTTDSAYVTYGLKQVTSGSTCDATSYAAVSSTALVADGTAVTASSTFSTTPNLAAAAATPVLLCFKVTLSTSAPNSFQGTSVPVTWTLAAQAGL